MGKHTHAANLLGLSTQIPMKIVYFTDGRSRTVQIGKKHIILKQTTPRNMATAGRISGLVIQALRHLGQQYVDDEIITRLDHRLDPDDKKRLLKDVRFPPAWIADIMRRLGKESDTEPTEKIKIHPYLKDAFPDLFSQAHFSVRAVSRERTFWEKAMLLHEETFRPPEKKRQVSMARHYYDLFRLIDAGVGHKAAGDLELFKRIAAHRQIYFRYTWVDYDTLCPGRQELVPSDEQLDSWKSDYSVMKDEMFFGKPPEFEDIIQTAREFQDEFNRKAVAKL